MCPVEMVEMLPFEVWMAVLQTADTPSTVGCLGERNKDTERKIQKQPYVTWNHGRQKRVDRGRYRLGEH